VLSVFVTCFVSICSGRISAFVAVLSKTYFTQFTCFVEFTRFTCFVSICSGCISAFVAVLSVFVAVGDSVCVRLCTCQRLRPSLQSVGDYKYSVTNAVLQMLLLSWYKSTNTLSPARCQRLRPYLHSVGDYKYSVTNAVPERYKYSVTNTVTAPTYLTEYYKYSLSVTGAYYKYAVRTLSLIRCHRALQILCHQLGDVW
jgi:hypothetical protein